MDCDHSLLYKNRLLSSDLSSPKLGIPGTRATLFICICVHVCILCILDFTVNKCLYIFLISRTRPPLCSKCKIHLMNTFLKFAVSMFTNTNIIGVMNK